MTVPGILNRMDEVGNIVSLFSGAGGLDIGFYLAGFNPIWANDIDVFATMTYQNLFPEHTVTSGNLLDQSIPKRNDVDLVIGGPPCQGFSVAGKMNPTDPRSKHVWNFLGVVDKLSPRGFVMENVKALAINSRWHTLIINLRKEAKKMGYKTELFVLNAANFGVPQARERMFLIGLKEGLIKAPTPTTLKSQKTVREALRDLPSFGEKGNDSICTAKITPARQPILRRSPYAGMLFNGQGRPLDLKRPSMTLPASMGGNRTPIVDQSLIENEFGTSWIEAYHKHLLTGGEPQINVPKSLRRLTVEEAAAIQTFPLGMNFYGTQTARFRQIGNAVPPLLAYHVALAVREVLLSSGVPQTVWDEELF